MPEEPVAVGAMRRQLPTPAALSQLSLTHSRSFRRRSPLKGNVDRMRVALRHMHCVRGTF
jgi:hypothetical protein